MPSEYVEMKDALRSLRWRQLFDGLLALFALSCLEEWKTFRLYGFKLGLAASVRSFGEVALYGIVMVPCVTLVWLLLLKALTLDSHKLGFRLGSLFGSHVDIDQPS